MTEINSCIEEGKPFLFEGNDVGVLLSHGYTGTTSSMKPLGAYLHETEGWTVFGPQLKGHGETPEAMSNTGAEDWIDSLEAGMKMLQTRCKYIFMAGLSMGGCLTMYLAAKYPHAFHAVSPINPCLTFSSTTLASLAYDTKAPKYIEAVGGDVKDNSVREIAYERLPVSTIREIYALMAITRDLLPEVRSPTLILSSPEDHLIPSSSSQEILARISSTRREMLLLRNSYHVATIDFDKEIINEAIRKFFRKNIPFS